MSSLTREEVLQYLEKFAEAAWSSGPDIGKLLAHDAAQRATIEAQAQRIAKLEAMQQPKHESYEQRKDREYVEAVTGATLQPQKTLHDEYTMAAMTGLLANPSSWNEGDPKVITWARNAADEALRQRKGEP